MSKYISNRTSICNIVCAVLMVILLVLQFMPFWTYGEEEAMTSSIQGYIWFPTEKGDLENYLQAQTSPEFTINDILVMPIVVLVAGAVGVVLCLIKPDNMLVSLLPAACGLVGIWGYLSKAAFRLGANWQLHLVLCIAILAAAAISLLSGLKEIKAN